MYHPARVRIGQGIGRLFEQLRHHVECRPWLAHKARRQTLPLHQLHGKAHQAAFLVHGINGHDVRVIQPGSGLRFTNETLPHLTTERQLGR